MMNTSQFTTAEAAEMMLPEALQQLQPVILLDLYINIILLPFSRDDLPCETTLQYVSDLLEYQLQSLGGKNRDATYSSLSQIIRQAHARSELLCAEDVVGLADAERHVSRVQMQMVLRMRGYDAFNMQVRSLPSSPPVPACAHTMHNA
eukprot:8429366-Pyramimonas_sp.AAC.1